MKFPGLPDKTCEKCRNHGKKWKDAHNEHTKKYKEFYNEEKKESIKEKKRDYYQANNVTIIEKAKAYRQTYKDNSSHSRKTNIL